MKKNCLKSILSLALVVLGLAMASNASAWTGASSVTTRSGNASDANTYFLYNVGTGLFLTSNGHWGTECCLEAVGLPLWFVKDGNGYDVYTKWQSNYIGIISGRTVTPNSTGTSQADNDENGVFVDGNTNLYFVSLNSSEPYQFAIRTSSSSNSTYLVQTGAVDTDASDARKNIVTTQTYTSTSSLPDGAKWMLISKTEILNSFSSADMAGASAIDCSFMITDPGLRRKVERGWAVSGLDTDGYYKIGNSLGIATMNDDGAYVVDNDNFDSNGDDSRLYDNNLTLLESPEYNVVNSSCTSGKSQETNQGTGTDINGNAIQLMYNDGRNYHVRQADVDGEYTSLSVGDDRYYNGIYGGYYNGRIAGSAGTLTQTVTVNRAGWYRFSCDGYIYGTGSGTAKIYAQVGTGTAYPSYQETELMKIGDYMDMTASGIAFYNGGKDSQYRKYALVYAEENSTITLGIKIENGTAATVTNFDDFRLAYCGNTTKILLNEEEASNEYMLAQEDEALSHTLLLKRKFVPGQWNSLVLPVYLTPTKLRTAFGNNVKLCKLRETPSVTNNCIYFDLVDLDNVTNAIEPGVLYVIKPYNESTITSGTYYVNDDNSGYSMTATEDSPIWTFNNVTFDSAPGPTFENVTPMPSTDTHELTFCGSYVYLPGTSSADAENPTGVSPYSYVLNANTGEWVHWVGSTYLAVKGFRCWISDRNSKPGLTGDDNVEQEGDGADLGAKLSIIIDGEEETTAIEGITYSSNNTISKNSNVYNVNGQLMRNSSNLENLPKGIYVVNGKKYIVK